MECWSNGVLETRLENSHACRIPTACSPSPQASPSGRGRTAARLSKNRCASNWPGSGGRCSLSLRERVGVRGNRPCLGQAVRILEQPLELRSTAALERCATPLLHHSITPFQLGGGTQ